MHEYNVVSELIDRVEEEARIQGADRVHAIIVRLGELSGVEPTLFKTAFDTFRERTICESAELVIEPVAARWACPRCGARFDRGNALQCTACARPAVLVEGGELLLQRIEMEVSDHV